MSSVHSSGKISIFGFFRPSTEAASPPEVFVFLVRSGFIGPSFHTPFAIQFDARVGFLSTYGSFADLPPVLWHSVIPGHFLPENSPYRPIRAPIRSFASQCNALLIHADISRRMTHKTDIPLHFYLDCLIIDTTISLSEPECLRVTIYGIWPIGCSWKRLHLPLGKGMAAYENAAS